MAYKSYHSGQQIDEAVDLALNPDTAVTEDSTELVTSGAAYAANNATQGLLAPVESSTTASQPYSEGDLLILNGVLYQVTVAIASGGAITPGMNCTATTLEALIAAAGNVAANPALSGNELDLKSLEVSGTKYVITLIRPNLLDNAYFVGGGSQQGGGKLPVNQRAQTVYSGQGYTVDRYIATNSRLTTTVGSDGLTLSANSNGNAFLRQFFGHALSGEFTLSALISGSGTATIAFYPYDSSSGIASASITNPGSTMQLVTVTADITDANDFQQVAIRVAAGTTVKLHAFKLELGDTQTLAHNEGTDENPVWELNEIPDYATELIKCMRYFRTFRTQSLRPTYGADYSPPMATAEPTLGTITIDGTTYYTASSEPT